MKEIFGFDVGGVILDKANDHTDTSFFSDNHLASTAVPGAIEALAGYTQTYSPNSIYVVSKCGVKIQRKTIEWFKYHEFFTKTGIKPEHVHFCIERKQKAPICQVLGINNFVDDRLEVLSYLSTVENKYAFNPSYREMEKYSHILANVTIVYSWQELTKLHL